MTSVMEKVIEVERLAKKFGGFTAVDHISFDVYRGEIFGFLGANGAGKTTAMRMLCGLSKPSFGTGRVVGFDISRETEKIKSRIGYMSQKFSLYETLTVRENIRLYGGIYGMSRCGYPGKDGSGFRGTRVIGGTEYAGAIVAARGETTIGVFRGGIP